MLNSVLRQTYTNWECLLINDGSIDSSSTICSTFVRGDSRFIVHDKTNGGVSSARNLGITKAIGEWLFFCDADDFLYPDALQTLVEGTHNNIELVMGGYEVYEENDTLTYAISKRDTYILSFEESVRQMYISSPYCYQGYTWNKLFRREHIIRHNLCFFEDIFFNEDRLFCLQYICRTHCTTYYNLKPVYRYYRRDTGAMASLKKKYNQKQITDFVAMVRMYKTLNEYKINFEIKKIARFFIAKSYIDIRKHMKEYQYHNQAESWYMQKDLLSTGAYFYYLKEIIRQFAHSFL